MTFVSYAQNFEDVMLWRALRHVSAGFYIDVGAQHPDEDSVTRAFYERGWSGINVEPVPAYARRLQAARWRDTTLAVALGSTPGHAVLQVVENTGLSTLDRETAGRHRADGRTVHEIPVAVDTLAAICQRHVRGPVHFLKIDVEGAERAVLEGADFAAFRPWIVLLEATAPNSTAETHAEWESLLLAAGYGFAWFDGLNRFYVADEHAAELSPHFRVPPNVFDDFMRMADTEFALRAGTAEAEAARLRERLATAEEREGRAAFEASEARILSDLRGQELARHGELLHAARTAHATENLAWTERTSALERQVDALHRQLDAERQARNAERQQAMDERDGVRALLEATHRSTSWRVTAPLRRVSALVRVPPSAPAPAPAALPAPPPASAPVQAPAQASGPVPLPGQEITLSPVEARVPAVADAAGPRAARPRHRTVHQYHSGSAVGDAITNSMLLLRGLLRGWGYRSDIFVSHRDDAMADELRLLDELPAHDGYVLLVHHSMGFAAFDRIAALPAPKVLVFHNITPPGFLADPFMQEHARLGRDQLARLRPLVAASLADSEYNAVELRRLGFDAPEESTLLFDLDALRARAGAARRGGPHRGADAPFTVLFVGRVCAAKGQAELVDAFAAFRSRFPGPSRLVLPGRHGASDPYMAALRARIAAAGLAEDVVLPGLVSDDELHALYAGADVYVSLSLHEGFGVPLVEAMAHGVPVLAWPAGAIPYTLGGAAALLPGRDPGPVADAMLALATDPASRAAIAARQDAALDRFRLDRQTPALLRALAQAGAAPPALPGTRAVLDANMRFTVTGHASGSYSLASVNRTLVLALDGARPGHARLLPVEGQPTTVLHGIPAGDAERITALAARPPHETGPEVVISQHYPVFVPEHRGDLLLAWFFWEESTVPAATIDQLNGSFDGVLAPSSFVAKALVDSGLSIPVAVVGFAPALGPFRTLDARQGGGDGTFTFLHVSSCFPRKGVDVLLSAYAAAFRANDPVRLVVKGFPNPHNDVADQVARLRAADPDAPTVAVIDEDLPDAAVPALFRDADAVVLPTRGEGFNIPAAEAMAAGVPLVVTGYGGHMDFCTPATARLLAFSFAPSGSHIASPGSVWAEPDAADLAAALREAVEDRRSAAERARGAAQAAVSLADGGAFARRVADAALDMLLAPPRAPLRIAWVSTWNVRCGVAEYSRHLVEALPADPAVAGVTVLCDRRTPSHPDTGDMLPADDGAAAQAAVRVVPCWGVYDTVSLSALDAALAEADPGIVVVQHQPGLFRWRNLALLLRGPAVASRPAVVTLHSTRHLGEIDAEERRFALHTLRSAARVVVHTAADLNLLRALGLGENVTLVPHGAVARAPALDGAPGGSPDDAPDDTPVIGCYGFFLPDKGIAQLIEAAAILRQHWPQLRLRLVNAEYGMAASAEEIARCRALAASLQVPVEWHTAFLPHEESRALLAGTTVVVLPYQGSMEASSASVRSALSAGPPVAVTPLPLFDEAADAVFRLPGASPDAIAAGLDALLQDQDRRAALRSAGAAWLAARDWSLVARRFQGMLLGLHRANAP